MNNDSERVLGMLSEGKITVDQAERLLEALSGNGQTHDAAPDSPTETQPPDFGDDEEEAHDERDRREPIWLGPGVQTGPGIHVSPDGSFRGAIGAGATVRERVVVEGVITIGAGATIRRNETLRRLRDQSWSDGWTARDHREEGEEGAFIFEKAKIGEDATIGVGAQIGQEAEVSPGSHVPLGGQVPPGTVW